MLVKGLMSFMMVSGPLLSLAVAQTLIWAGVFYIFPALLLRWEAAFGWSKLELTGAVSLAIAVAACISPLAGRFIDRGYGPHLLTGAALLGGGLLFILSGVDQRWEFYLVWLGLGLTMGCGLYEPCFALLIRPYGEQAKKRIIFITLIAGFAGTVSFPSAHFLSDWVGWRNTVQVFSCILILVAAPLMWFGAVSVNRDRVHSAALENNETKLSLLRSRPFWLLAMGFSFIALSHGVVLHHLLSILHGFGVCADISVAIGASIGPMQVFGRVVVMALANHVTNHKLAVSCFLVVMAAIFILLWSSGSLWLLFLFVVLFGSGYGIVSVIRPSVARDVLGQSDFGAKAGALALLYWLGIAIAPYFGALLWGIGGYDFTLSILIGLVLMGMLLYLGSAKLSGINKH